MVSSPLLPRRILNEDDNVGEDDDEQISSSSSSDFLDPKLLMSEENDSDDVESELSQNVQIGKPSTDIQKTEQSSNIHGRKSIHHKVNSKSSSFQPDLNSKFKSGRDVPDFSKNSTKNSKPALDKRSSPKETSKDSKPEEKRSYVIGIAFFLAFICAFPYFTQDNADANKSDIINIKHEIKMISSGYHIQNKDVWNQLLSGIQRLINQEKEPTIFFLVQWSEENDTAFNIALAAGDITARNLSYPDDVVAPVVLSPDSLNHLDRGDLIDLFQKDLEMSHVLIVRNIEKVSPHIAQDFRYYCDEDNPLVDKAIIFFIMNMENCTSVTLADIYEGPLKNTITAVEKCLTEFWGSDGGLDETILYPVLSRLINIVLPIQDVSKNT